MDKKSFKILRFFPNKFPFFFACSTLLVFIINQKNSFSSVFYSIKKKKIIKSKIDISIRKCYISLYIYIQ